MNLRRRSLSLVAALTLASTSLSGCTEDHSKPPGPGADASSGQPDAAAPSGPDAALADPDAGAPEPGADAGAEPGPDAGPLPPTVETLGAFLPAMPRSVLTGVAKPVLVLGSLGVPLDPAWFGLPSIPDSSKGWIRNGLIVVDTATGRTRLLGKADGVPTMQYTSLFGEDFGHEPAPFLDMAWVRQDVSFVAAAHAMVVKATFGADGALSFATKTLRPAGATVDAVVGKVGVLGGEVLASTDMGLAALDAETLEVKRWITGLDVGGPTAWVHDIAVADLDGPAAAVLVGTPQAKPSRIALVREGVADAQILVPADGALPLSVASVGQAILVGLSQADGRGAIAALRSDAGQVGLATAVSADQLAASKFADIKPHRLAYDGARAQLLIGGAINPATAGDPFAFDGRGLVALGLSPDLSTVGEVVVPVQRNDPLFRFIPWQVELLHVDAQGRWYVGGLQLCSPTKFRAAGLVRLEPSGEEVRVVRPYVSGVRAIAVDPVNGDTWLGLRDENPGLTCSGATVQQGACRLKADGSCELFAPINNVGSNPYDAEAGAGAIAFGDPARREMALAPFRGNAFARVNDVAQIIDVPLDPHINQWLNSAAWGVDGSLWMGSRMEWEEFGDPQIDDDAANLRGPNGLGLITFDAAGARLVSRRYVREMPSATWVEVVPGLPSSSVWDALPLSGDRRALVACGAERNAMVYDHLLPAVNSRNYLGGLALVEDFQVTAIPAPEGLPLTDVVSLARGEDGTLYALDAEAGIVTVDVGTLTAEPWAEAAWKAPARAKRLAVAADGRLAVATSESLFVYGADGQVQVEFGAGGAYGAFWSVRFTAEGHLYAGSDQGLLRIALDGGTLSVPGRTGPLASELWPLTANCGGGQGCVCTQMNDCLGQLVCIPDAKGAWTCQEPCAEENCACRWTPSCAEGLRCDQPVPFRNGVCVVPSPCELNPNGKGCECTLPGTCDAGLVCGCDGVGCFCNVDPATCANGACACVENYECPLEPSWYCNTVQGHCAQKQACDADCTCTPEKCSEGLECKPSMNGESCQSAGGILPP